jgi:Magnesium chelatase, subunit ChlI
VIWSYHDPFQEAKSLMHGATGGRPTQTAILLARRVFLWVDCDAFVLIAAMNPCPCGYSGDLRCACSCAPGAIGRSRNRGSGYRARSGRDGG